MRGGLGGRHRGDDIGDPRALPRPSAMGPCAARTASRVAGSSARRSAAATAAPSAGASMTLASRRRPAWRSPTSTAGRSDGGRLDERARAVADHRVGDPEEPPVAALAEGLDGDATGCRRGPCQELAHLRCSGVRVGQRDRRNVASTSSIAATTARAAAAGSSSSVAGWTVTMTTGGSSAMPSHAESAARSGRSGRTAASSPGAPTTWTVAGILAHRDRPGGGAPRG